MTEKVAPVRALEAVPIEVPGESTEQVQRLVLLRDPWHYIDENLTVSLPVYLVLTLIDGTRSIAEVQEDFEKRYGGKIAAQEIEKLVDELDRHGLLVNERFEALRQRVTVEFIEAPVRKAAHAGSAYEGEAEPLRAQIDGFYKAAGETEEGLPPGVEPGPAPALDQLRGIVAPHIDPRVGGVCAARAYHPLEDIDPAPDLFVIFGTAHQPGESLFMLTEKDFETPFGMAEVDREVATALMRDCPFDLKQEEFAHKHEHSIEFQTIFLQHAFARRSNGGDGADLNEKAFRILPILVGSFHEMIETNLLPSAHEQLQTFSRSLAKAISDCGRRACFVAGADLSHMGRKFGDDRDLSDEFIDEVRTRDLEMLGHVQRGDAEAFFRHLQADRDQQKVCGLPPIYLLMHLIGNGVPGRLVGYDINVEEPTQSFVSFASVVF